MFKNTNTFLHTNLGKSTKSSVSSVPGIKLPKADVSGIQSVGKSAKEKIGSIVSYKDFLYNRTSEIGLPYLPRMDSAAPARTRYCSFPAYMP